MPNWLTKATGGGRSSESDDVQQPFQLRCECAERHIGQRKTRPQRIICQTCGAALFVLPKNVYPVLKERPSSKKPSRKRRNGGPPTGPGLPSTQELASSVRQGLFGVAEGIGNGISRAGEALIQGLRSAAAAAVHAVRSFFTPFRLVLTGIAVMLLVTAAMAVRSRSLESARETFRKELAAGQEALENDNLTTARDHFAAAAAAVQTLGSHDAQSILVRQLHRETTAMTRLAPGSLFEMVEEAEQSLERLGGVSWDYKFGARYDGMWLVLHAPVREADSSYVLALPLTVGAESRRVIVRVDLADFRRLPATDGVINAIFAAPLRSCEFDEEKNAWIVTLDGATGFLWSHLENLRPLGFFAAPWVDEAAVADLLSSQTEQEGRTSL